MFKMSKYFCVFKNTERIKNCLSGSREEGGREAALLDNGRAYIQLLLSNLIFCTRWLVGNPDQAPELK